MLKSIMNRLALIIMFAVGLSACTTSGSETTANASLDRVVRPVAMHEAGRRAEPNGQNAVASLSSGRITKVTSTSEAGRFHQVIELGQAVSGLQTNVIDVRFVSAAAQRDEAPAAEKPTEASIRAELAARFPRMTMRIVDRPRTNTYGVYGLAVGKWANGASCIYAWQWIDHDRAPAGVGPTDAVSLRTSLCRMGTTLDELADLADAIHLDLSHITSDSRLEALYAVEVSARPSRARSRRGRAAGPGMEARDHPRSAVSANTVALFAVSTPERSTAVAEPLLDQSLPAAAYQGPSIKAAMHSAVQ